MTVRFANINCTHLERSCTNVADKVRYRRTGACESQCTMILANRFQVILTQFFLYFIHQILPYNQPGTWQFPGQLKDAWSSALIPCMEQLQYQRQPLRSRSHGSGCGHLLQ